MDLKPVKDMFNKYRKIKHTLEQELDNLYRKYRDFENQEDRMSMSSIQAKLHIKEPMHTVLKLVCADLKSIIENYEKEM